MKKSIRRKGKLLQKPKKNQLCKIIAVKWIDGEISSYQYENRINRIIDEGFLDMKHVEQNSIPDWVKISAKKWIDDELTQKEYFDLDKEFTTNEGKFKFSQIKNIPSIVETSTGVNFKIYRKKF